jgi:hypothetical protein
MPYAETSHWCKATRFDHIGTMAQQFVCRHKDLWVEPCRLLNAVHMLLRPFSHMHCQGI